MKQQTENPNRRSQGGTTLVEASIVSFLTAGVLAMLYGGVVAVNGMTTKNTREAKAQNQQRSVLERIRGELEQTGKTGRYTIAKSGRSITYTKLVGAVQTDNDVSGVWSQTFVIALKGDTVVRTEAGKTVSWGKGVKDLQFVKKAGDDFITLKCTTKQEGKDVMREVTVFPLN